MVYSPSICITNSTMMCVAVKSSRHEHAVNHERRTTRRGYDAPAFLCPRHESGRVRLRNSSGDRARGVLTDGSPCGTIDTDG